MTWSTASPPRRGCPAAPGPSGCGLASPARQPGRIDGRLPRREEEQLPPYAVADHAAAPGTSTATSRAQARLPGRFRSWFRHASSAHISHRRVRRTRPGPMRPMCSSVRTRRASRTSTAVRRCRRTRLRDGSGDRRHQQGARPGRHQPRGPRPPRQIAASRLATCSRRPPHLRRRQLGPARDHHARGLALGMQSITSTDSGQTTGRSSAAVPTARRRAG